MRNRKIEWFPTPTFLYRNYLYGKFAKTLPKGSYVLDVGTGNGEFIKILLKLGFKCDALDISKRAVELAKNKFKNEGKVTIMLGDILGYQVNREYDAIFCFETLEHIKKDKLALNKIYRLLKPSGKLVISIPAHMSEWSRIDELKGHYRRYEKNVLIKDLNNIGFKVQRVYSYGFPLLWLLRRISKTGKFLRTKNKKSKDARGWESSIQQEYNPRLRFFVNTFVMYPMFKIMDLFLETDFGFGYIVIAKKR